MECSRAAAATHRPSVESYCSVYDAINQSSLSLHLRPASHHYPNQISPYLMACSRERRASSIHEVSADFLRLNGSRQQFRSLLGRKKLGQMPPAYTRVDYSRDSIESSPSVKVPLIGSCTPHNPEIRVEEAGNTASFERDRVGTLSTGDGDSSQPLSQLQQPKQTPASTAASAQNQHRPRHKLSISSLLVDSKNSSVESKSTTTGENGGLVTSPSNLLGICPPKTHHSNLVALKRNNSRYGGTPIDESQVKMVYRLRSNRLNTRVRITDRCLLLAMIGIALMVVDNEVCGQQLLSIDSQHPVSRIIRALALVSTLALLLEIIHFHINEVMLDLVDCGADDFRVVLRWPRVVRFAAEFILCSFCPLPVNGTVTWSFVEPRHLGHITSVKDVPINVLLSMLMLSRVYLVGRFMVLHSKQFQDASTRTLAALNRIQVNFAFVFKTMLDQRPILFLSVFLPLFWLVTAWTFAQCERWGREGETTSILYTNALWFIAITFNGNGYGDIVPKTLAGKIIAITVGIFGAIITAILIAVISRKILLSQGQRNVNNFMNDSRLMQMHKNAAARVLQKTWLIYKCLQENNTSDHLLRKHQRRFLDAIHDFRRIKNKMRVFGETNSTSFQQMNRLISEMHSSMTRVLNNQEEMRAQIEVLQRAMRNHFIEAPRRPQSVHVTVPTSTTPSQYQYQYQQRSTSPCPSPMNANRPKRAISRESSPPTITPATHHHPPHQQQQHSK